MDERKYSFFSSFPGGKEERRKINLKAGNAYALGRFGIRLLLDLKLATWMGGVFQVSFPTDCGITNALSVL